MTWLSGITLQSAFNDGSNARQLLLQMPAFATSLTKGDSRQWHVSEELVQVVEKTQDYCMGVLITGDVEKDKK